MKKIILLGLFISIALVFFIAPFASSSPDGLEKVGQDKGFLHKGEGQEVFNAPFPDYTISWIQNEKISTSLSGLIGIFFTFLIIYILGYFVKKQLTKKI
ncbi:MAG: PDGLE domain-containing protein [bacterium]